MRRSARGQGEAILALAAVEAARPQVRTPTCDTPCQAQPHPGPTLEMGLKAYPSRTKDQWYPAGSTSRLTWGAAKNCAIFPIDSLWRLPRVALLKSKHEYRISNGNRINMVGGTRDHIVFDPGCFQAFRAKTTLQK